MLAAIASLTLLGTLLGLALGIAAIRFAVDGDPLVDEIAALMPGSNCGQCGMAGCSAAAQAIAEGSATVTVCPPGGKALATALAAKLGVAVDLAGIADDRQKIAEVREEICIGCAKCLKVCPTDAIIGAQRQIHNVIREACNGCGACVARCPTEAMQIKPAPISLSHWVWPNPAATTPA